jgi:G3E family GTPase
MSALLQSSNAKIPVTILTGYLGSGKTTFVNHLMREKHGFKIAIIENEYGEVAIDDGLVTRTTEDIVELMNGCICCTVRDDLIVALKRLATDKRGMFDHVLIETTGLADPAPVAQTFFVDEDMKKLFSLDAIVTFVDSKHTLQHLNEYKPEGVENEAVEQVAFADVLVLNKTDLATRSEIDTLIAKVKSINSTAKIIESQYSKVDFKEVIDIKRFDLEKILEMDDGFLDVDGEHMHDNSVSSVGIVMEGSFYPDRFQGWLSTFLKERGADIFRSKGILSFVDNDEKIVFHGVHMMLQVGGNDNSVLANWREDEKRTNKLCFIGRNLNRKEIIAALEECIFDGKVPEPGPKPTSKLRFPVGTRVRCNVGGWEAGIVIQQWYRETLWPTGKYVPYQVQLDNGSLIWAPVDSNKLIKLF